MLRLLIVAILSACATGIAATLSQEAVAGQATIYLCPMHPEVRGQRGDRCPICRMALVASSQSHLDAFTLDFELTPRTLRAGQRGRLRILVREPHSGAVVHQFEAMHERIFHLFVVSQDLEYFAHTHPALGKDGALEADVELPRPGAYQFIADFMPAGASPQLIQKSFVTAGYAGRLAVTPTPGPDTADKILSGTRVSLTMPDAVAGREQLVTFDLTDEVTGRPVSDLELYLGASGHVFLLSADSSVALHTHPVEQLSKASGPTVVVQLLFPKPGAYRMWAQFQRHNAIITAPFTVPVKGRF